MQTLIMGFTKFMYTLRLWKLRRFTSKWIPIGLVVFLTFDYAMGTLFAYEVFTVELLHDLVSIRFKPIAMISMCTTTASDFLIGGLLIYTLAKSNVNLSWTNSSLTMLIAYLMNTGILTGFMSAAVLISYAVNVYNPIFIISEIALPQFYVNCFLSMMIASIYFQTSQNLQGPSITHVLPYFHNDLGPTEGNSSNTDDGLQLSSSSSLVITSKSGISPLIDANVPTINEIGLPLYQVKMEPEPVIRNIPVQVVIQTTQNVAFSDIRLGRTVLV